MVDFECYSKYQLENLGYFGGGEGLGFGGEGREGERGLKGGGVVLGYEVDDLGSFGWLAIECLEELRVNVE